MATTPFAEAQLQDGRVFPKLRGVIGSSHFDQHFCSVSLGVSQVVDHGTLGSSFGISAKAASVELRPSPEMQKLLDTFVGKWEVSESFEISATRQGKTRQGIAFFGPALDFR